MKTLYEVSEPKDAFFYSDIANPYVKYVLNHLCQDHFPAMSVATAREFSDFFIL
jgi:hypothetical protein